MSETPVDGLAAVPALRLDLPAEPTRLAVLRRAVDQWATDAGVHPDTIADLRLALTEAVSNAIEHAYRTAKRPGGVCVDLDVDADGGVRARVADTGVWRPPPADPGFRGRGLHVIAGLAGGLDVDTGPGGTVVRFRLAPVG